MALWIRDTSVVPPEGWIYPSLSGEPVRAPNYGSLYGKVVEHYTANNAPVPSEQEVIDWLCANVHVPCHEMETRQPLINKFTLNLPSQPTSCCGSKK